MQHSLWEAVDAGAVVSHFDHHPAGTVRRRQPDRALGRLAPGDARFRAIRSRWRAEFDNHGLAGEWRLVADQPRGGALLVEEISGRPPRLSEDFPAIANALAAIHALPSACSMGTRPMGTL